MLHKSTHTSVVEYITYLKLIECTLNSAITVFTVRLVNHTFLTLIVIFQRVLIGSYCSTKILKTNV